MQLTDHPGISSHGGATCAMDVLFQSPGSLGGSTVSSGAGTYPSQTADTSVASGHSSGFAMSPLYVPTTHATHPLGGQGMSPYQASTPGLTPAAHWPSTPDSMSSYGTPTSSQIYTSGLGVWPRTPDTNLSDGLSRNQALPGYGSYNRRPDMDGRTGWNSYSTPFSFPCPQGLQYAPGTFTFISELSTYLYRYLQLKTF